MVGCRDLEKGFGSILAFKSLPCCLQIEQLPETPVARYMPNRHPCLITSWHGSQITIFMPVLGTSALWYVARRWHQVTSSMARFPGSILVPSLSSEDQCEAEVPGRERPFLRSSVCPSPVRFQTLASVSLCGYLTEALKILFFFDLILECVPLRGVGRELEEDPTAHTRYQESRRHGFASPPVQSMTLVRVSTDDVQIFHATGEWNGFLSKENSQGLTHFPSSQP